MPRCPFCHRPASTRDGFDAAGRQRYACHSCRRDFTERSVSAFAGYRWPAEVILLAMRWSVSHPLSASSVMELLAERGIEPEHLVSCGACLERRRDETHL